MLEQLTTALGKVYLTIEYDHEGNWVYANWIGYQSFSNVVTGAEAVFKWLHHFNCPYLLNDNTLVYGSWEHAVTWLTTKGLPHALEAGLTHFAHVLPTEELAIRSAETLNIGITGKPYMRTFGDLRKAQQWLREAQAGQQ